MKTEVQKLEESKTKNLRLKENGERIVIDFNNCEFKTGITPQLNQETFSRVQMIDALYDPNRNHILNNSTMTYITYKHKNGDTVEKFVSEPFSTNETMLKYYISKNNIILYVDRFDRNQYFFNVE